MRWVRTMRRAGLVLGVAVAQPAAAQERVLDAGLFRWFQGDREIGRETFRRTPDAFQSESAIPLLNVRLRYRSQYDETGRLARFEAEVLSFEADTVIRSFRAVAEGDSLRLSQSGGPGGERRRSVAVPGVEAIAAAQTLAAYAELVRRAEGRARSFRAWAPEANDTVPIAVAFEGDSAVVMVGPFEIVARLGATGRVDRIEVPIQRIRAVRWTGDSLPPLEGVRRPTPDYSAPPGAPYTAQEVRIPVRTPAADTFSLAGTLTLPARGRAPYPAVVTITGSGGQNRDEELWPVVDGYRPFRQIAERLAEVGIAVLRCDDRGVSASAGDPSRATSADLADDVRAAVAWLRARSDIAPDRIALLGHSEGGVTGPMVAASDRRIAALVVMAGSAKPGVRILIDQVTWPIESTPGMSAERKAALRADVVRSVEADSANPSPWVRFFRTYDPLPTARRVSQPVLILHGALDRQVSVGQADTLAQALREGGNRDVTVRLYPGLNHLFVVSPTDGSPSEYPALRDVAVAREVLDTMAEWLAARLAPGRARRGAR